MQYENSKVHTYVCTELTSKVYLSLIKNVHVFYNTFFITKICMVIYIITSTFTGNKSFQALQTIGMKYDCSWPTQSYMDPPLWPYTLDYKSEQDCPIGECPTASFPGIWVQPMVNWRDTSGYVCSMVDACIFV